MGPIVYPFEFMRQGEHYFCPKCARKTSALITIERKMCNGGWFKKCPRGEHFHRDCQHCKGQWIELPLDSTKKISGYIVDSLVSLEKNGGIHALKLNDLLQHLQEVIIRQVTES